MTLFSIAYRGARSLNGGDVGRTRGCGAVGPDSDLLGRGAGSVFVDGLHPYVVVLVGTETLELVGGACGVSLVLLVVSLR